MEQQQVYNLANFTATPIFAGRPATHNGENDVARVAIANYFCPSRRAPTSQYNGTLTRSRNDYAGCAGFFTGQDIDCDFGNCGATRNIPAPPNGATPNADERATINLGNTGGRKGAIVWSGRGAKRTISEFSDGTSNSILVSEKSLPPDRHGTDGGDNEMWQNAGWDEDNIRWHFPPVPDALAPSLSGFCSTPSSPKTGGTLWRRMFGSSHAGGANALLADGSVRFLKFSIDRSTMRRLAVIDDNEPLSADSY
jgi:prepilin-type processing-associated H-X9-DG protein